MLTVSGVLLHALLGCCAHHAHAAGTPSALVSIDRPNEPAAHVCRHAGEERPAEEHEHDGPQQPCEEGACQFLSAGKSKPPHAEAWLQAVPPSPLAAVVLIDPRMGESGGSPRFSARTIPNLRQHALVQVWLI